MKRFINSFKCAINGFLLALKTEQNLRIHTVIMFIVILFGIILKITKSEWIICIVLFGMVISLELVNTAIEDIVDVIIPQKDDRAKRIKDISASAVLISAIVSAIIGLMIFMPRIF